MTVAFFRLPFATLGRGFDDEMEVMGNALLLQKIGRHFRSDSHQISQLVGKQWPAERHLPGNLHSFTLVKPFVDGQLDGSGQILLERSHGNSLREERGAGGYQIEAKGEYPEKITPEQHG